MFQSKIQNPTFELLKLLKKFWRRENKTFNEINFILSYFQF